MRFARKRKRPQDLARQGERPQPLTETISSAVTKRNSDYKALPVLIVFPGLQLAARDRNCPFDELRRGRIFFFLNRGLVAVTNATVTVAYATVPSSILDSSALQSLSKSSWKQHKNICGVGFVLCFSPFYQLSANYFFFFSCRHLEKRIIR